MSFNIPIFLEDSPFFERDSLFQRQPRNKSQRFARRVEESEPFQTWMRPEFVYEEDPREERNYRPNYQNRGRRDEFTEQPRRNERCVRPQWKTHTQKSTPNNSAVKGGEREDVYVTEDPRCVNEDGWDIPVQIVEAPVTRRHQHRRHKQQQEPWHCATRENDAQVENGHVEVGGHRLQKSAARGVKDKVTKGVDKVKDDTTEEMPVDEAQMERRYGRKGETEKLENDKEKDSKSYQSSKDNDGNTEITVHHSSDDEKPRRSSRRFSQCEPPPLVEIKMTRIRSIVEKSQDLENKVKEFSDPVQNKTYLNISESLMRLLLDLDTVDSEGIDVVRKSRKEGVEIIQRLVDELENRLAENKKNATSE